MQEKSQTDIWKIKYGAVSLLAKSDLCVNDSKVQFVRKVT